MMYETPSSPLKLHVIDKTDNTDGYRRNWGLGSAGRQELFTPTTLEMLYL